MKRFAMAALAAATFVAPLSISTTASADNGRHRGWDRNDRDYDNRDDRRDERRAYNQGYREGRHDDRRADNRWDDRRYNGYWHSGRWYYGPPPQAYRDVRYDYRHYRRGDRIPAYYRDRYRPIDYGYYGYAPPPRGYHYVRNNDNGEVLLVGIATGVVLGAILANN